MSARLAETEAAVKRADGAGAASAKEVDALKKEVEAQKKRAAELQASAEAAASAREQAVAAAKRDSEAAAKVRRGGVRAQWLGDCTPQQLGACPFPCSALFAFSIHQKPAEALSESQTTRTYFRHTSSLCSLPYCGTYRMDCTQTPCLGPLIFCRHVRLIGWL